MREQEDDIRPVERGSTTSWRNWIMISLPLFVVGMIGIKWLGFAMMIPTLTALLASTLLYQRYVKKRAWGAILWGRVERDKR